MSIGDPSLFLKNLHDVLAHLVSHYFNRQYYS